MAVNLQLQNFILKLQDWGISDVMLPFVLIFTIIYAILHKTKILGEGKKNFNAVVAVVVALLVVIPHISPNNPFSENSDPVNIINKALPQVSLILVAVVFLMIMIGVFGQDMVFLGLAAPGWILFFSIAVILIIFGGAAGWWSQGFLDFLQVEFGDDAIAIAIMFLIFGIIIAWITSEPKDKDKSILNKIGVDTDKIYKK